VVSQGISPKQDAPTPTGDWQVSVFATESMTQIREAQTPGYAGQAPPAATGGGTAMQVPGQHVAEFTQFGSVC
jgi:hypothetical protein